MNDDETINQEEENTEQSSGETPIQLPELSEVDMLSAKIVELETSANQFKDQLLRKAAEFDNYKKRVESDGALLVKFSNQDLISKLLPVLDDFERSLKAHQEGGERVNSGASADGSAHENSYVRGIELIYSKFKKLLEMQGLKHFEVVGKPFDPEFHDALMQIQRKDVPHHTVIQEIEKGYMLHDKVIRHARVVVSAEPAEVEPQNGKQSEDDKGSGEAK